MEIFDLDGTCNLNENEFRRFWMWAAALNGSAFDTTNFNTAWSIASTSDGKTDHDMFGLKLLSVFILATIKAAQSATAALRK